MIDVKEFVRGENFPNVCDMRVGTEPNLDYEEQLEPPDKKHVSVYAKSENLSTAFNLISRFPDKVFTFVSHNSDMTINTCTMPENIVRWFAQNRNTDQPKIYSLPIGLENKYWHPYKDEVMQRTRIESMCGGHPARSINCFAQFNCTTHGERYHALTTVDPSVCDTMLGSNGNKEQHLDFCKNLIKYGFCLCPRGNGIDTHRLWEALYMGCIPICKKYHAHQFEHDLPILFVDEWSDITPELLYETYHQKNKRLLFDSEILKMSYWTEKINTYEL